MQGPNKYAYQPPLVPSLLGSSFQPNRNDHLLYLLSFPECKCTNQAITHILLYMYDIYAMPNL